MSKVTAGKSVSANAGTKGLIPAVPTNWQAHPHFKFTNLRPNSTGSATPYGLTPTQVRSAYGLGAYGSSPVTFNGIQGDGTGQTIVVVDAYDFPTALSDLNAFSSYFGLPQFVSGAGTTSQPGFTKYGVTNGTGLTSTLPATSHTWSEEEALDIEWAHVMAPKANITLVEASDSGVGLYYGDLYGAKLTGAVAVSNSWSGDEFSGETGDDFVFTSPSGHIGGSATATGTGIAGGLGFFFATGDEGAYSPNATTTITPQYPAASPNAIAVGGTHLNMSGNTYTSETAWGSGTTSGTNGGGGGGISAYEAQPAYQSGITNSFSSTKRVYPDISADADPSTGVPIYDSWDYTTTTSGGVTTGGPWLPGYEGGTSLATPLMAGMMAVIDQGRAINGVGSLDGVTQTLPAYYKLMANDLHDVVGGSIGPTTPSPSYAAVAGYDLATGLGSPGGTAHFQDMVSSTKNPSWLTASNTARFYISTHTLNVTGAVTINSDPGTDAPVVTGKAAAAVITATPASGATVHIGGLALTNGASFTLSSLGAARTSSNYRVLILGTSTATTTPTFTIDATSNLNLTDNDMILMYGSGTTPFTTIRSGIQQAYDGGLWDKTGITSSVAKTNPTTYGLGYAESTTLGLSSFDGQTLGTHAVLVKYTVLGDTTLVGSVGLTDYTTVTKNYGATLLNWTDGNFDFVNGVDLADYSAILRNYGSNL